MACRHGSISPAQILANISLSVRAFVNNSISGPHQTTCALVFSLYRGMQYPPHKAASLFPLPISTLAPIEFRSPSLISWLHEISYFGTAPLDFPQRLLSLQWLSATLVLASISSTSPNIPPASNNSPRWEILRFSGSTLFIHGMHNSVQLSTTPDAPFLIFFINPCGIIDSLLEAIPDFQFFGQLHPWHGFV